MRGVRATGSVVVVLALAGALLAGCSAPAAAERILGTWGDGTASTDSHLEFADDGKVTGSDGCNRIFGSWRTEDDAVVLSEVASTRMACPGVDSWLSGVAQVTLSDDGDQLTVSGADGKRIGTLDRVE